MQSYAYDAGGGYDASGGGGYMYAPAANIERTLYGTTVVRVAEDRPSRPQMMMPFLNQYANNQSTQPNALKVSVRRLLCIRENKYSIMYIECQCTCTCITSLDQTTKFICFTNVDQTILSFG